jgi:hypothetical protein
MAESKIGDWGVEGLDLMFVGDILFGVGGKL